jgi:hypothetical protein
MFGLVAMATDEGTDYWRPPLARLPFSGAASRARAIVDALGRGGLPARVHPDVPRALAFGAPALDLVMVGLECAGWSFSSLRNDRALVADVCGALVEALAVAARVTGAPAPWLLGRLSPSLVRLATRLVPPLVPFDAETYCRAHFTKVGDQTAQQLDTWIALGTAHGLGTDGLAGLRRRVSFGRPAQRRSA